MKRCLFAGARASSKLAIGDAVGAALRGRREDFVAGGKAVMVCEVEVAEDVVLLVLAMLPFCGSRCLSLNPAVSRNF